TGYGGSDKTIKGEFDANGWLNPLSHTRGVISMARNGYSYNSASSQFFILASDYPYWDGQYASFGEVVYGMDVIDALVAVPVGAGDRPLDPPSIVTASFVTPEQ
ncbi:MAG: peptidylprolyl isomerase, partial [Clostridia bacterium]|nr:peptidylprolyl isomerase [Clostridia bacterium]